MATAEWPETHGGPNPWQPVASERTSLIYFIFSMKAASQFRLGDIVPIYLFLFLLLFALYPSADITGYVGHRSRVLIGGKKACAFRLLSRFR